MTTLSKISSCYQISAIKDGTLDRKDILMNMSSDRAILNLYSCLVAQYALDRYPEDLDSKNTLIPTDKIVLKYFDSDKDGNLSLRRNPTSGDYPYRIVKKCSDILAFTEFYLNRLTSLSDNLIRSNMLTTQHYLAHVTRFGKGSNKDITVSMTDNPVMFKLKRKGNPRSYNPICKVRCTLLDVNGETTYTLSSNATHAYYDQLKTSEKDIIGFGSLLAFINEHEDIHLMVRLNGNIPKEMMNLYNDYWKDSPKRLESKKRLLPLNVLINYLVDFYRSIDDTRIGKEFRYMVEKDITAFRYGSLSPLEPFLGYVRPRDDNFETSHSSTEALYTIEPDYCEDVILYARVLHSVMMCSDVQEENNGGCSINLAFDMTKVTLMMMNPSIIDSTCPPSLIFCPGLEDVMNVYVEHLKKTVHSGVPKEMDVCGNRVLCNRIRIDWPSAKGNTENIWERSGGLSPAINKCCGFDEISEIVNGTNFHNHVILVTSPSMKRESEEGILSLGKAMVNVDYLIVFGGDRYVTVRRDLGNMVEVGIGGFKGLDEVHINSTYQLKKQAIIDVLVSWCKDSIIGSKEAIGNDMIGRLSDRSRIDDTYLLRLLEMMAASTSSDAMMDTAIKSFVAVSRDEIEVHRAIDQ